MKEYPNKCKCGVTLDTDSDYISHDCDYYPADIMEKDNIWDKPSNGFPLTSERGNRPNQIKEIQK